MRPIPILMVCALVLSLSSFAFAEYYVVKGDLGSFRIVDRKPMDSGAIVQGPFASRHEAEQVIYVGGPIKEGFLERETHVFLGPSAEQFWVVRGDLGSFRIVDSMPSDPGAIVQGPFANRIDAYAVVTAGAAIPGAPFARERAVTATTPVRGQFYVVRGDAGSFSVVDRQPSDPGVIVQGPFATRGQAYQVISGGGPLWNVPAAAGSGQMEQ